MEATSIVAPKAPKGRLWTPGELPVDPSWNSGYPHALWICYQRGLFVVSAVEKVQPAPGEEDVGPEYHLSISRRDPRHGIARCSSSDARWVLAQFDLEDATEDNHVPGGKVRNFWRPVADRFSGIICPCQDEEPAMREDRGDFVWRGVSR